MNEKELKAFNHRVKEWETKLLGELISCMLRGVNPPQDKKIAGFGASFFTRMGEADCSYWAIFSVRCGKTTEHADRMKCLSAWLILGQKRFSEIAEEAKPLEVPFKIPRSFAITAPVKTRFLSGCGVKQTRCVGI